MSNFKDLIKFNVEGLDVDVEENDRKRVEYLKARLNTLSKQNPKALIITTLSADKQVEIINAEKRITFYNASGSPVQILSARKVDYKVLLECIFCKTRRTFSMWLSTFLKDGTVVKPDKFAKIYLDTVAQRTVDLTAQLEALYKKYNDLYKTELNKRKTAVSVDANAYPELKKEASAHKVKKDLTAEECLKAVKKEKGVAKVKNYWNTKLTASEKATLMGWISSHIYSIRIYALEGGRSGSLLGKEFDNITGIHYTAPKYNEEGKSTSQDTIGGYVSFKDVKDYPVELFEKIVSAKRKFILDGGTHPNRLADGNLALFLVSEYSKYGFVPGVRHLTKTLQVIDLVNDKFKADDQSFYDAYLPF